ncbi:O-succinylbenzoic acid--CoA ligase [hydrothermal vent metagenome]|uniref:O-succinylbenzoic acid--CoA ligase n=1 Tax=hydrothermal vent metagenome TaxID=652676 RepID=A0A3B1ANI2_9ZZZZ
MLVRAMYLGLDLEVVEPSSDPLSQIRGNIDFAAMTPLQLSQSIAHGHLEKVKTVLVGGAQVNPALVKQIHSLKTRVFETWGMTETASHVAIRPLNGVNRSDYFSALPGVRFSQDERSCLIVLADHLGGKAIVTNDVVQLLNHHAFCWLGRYDNVINIGGVKIFPEVVEQKLAIHLAGRQFYITAIADEALGEKVVLLIEGELFPLPREIWVSLTKYEKPRAVRFLDRFSRTDNGKIIRGSTL